MALSGWCGQRGIPNCAGCLSTDCGCGCHTGKADTPPSEESD